MKWKSKNGANTYKNSNRNLVKQNDNKLGKMLEAKVIFKERVLGRVL